MRLYEASGGGSQIGGWSDPHPVAQRLLLMVPQRTQQMALGQPDDPYLRSSTHS